MKMEKLKRCRICLAENVRMIVVADKNLQEIYEKMTDLPFVTEDSRPMLACFFCYAKLKQCGQLHRKCIEAEKLFSQMLNGDYETKLLINQDLLEFFGGFVITPTVHISVFDGYQTERNDIKEELLDTCDGQDDIIEPKEEYQSELEHEYQYIDYVESYAALKGMPPHHSNLDSEDDVPLMEFRTKLEVKQDVSKKKRTGNKTKRTPVAKKPKRNIRRPKLEDTITTQQKKTEQPDSKISRNTQNRTSKPVTKFKKPFINTKLIVNDSINKAIDKSCRNKSNKDEFTSKIWSSKGIQNDGIHRRLSVKEKPFKCDFCQRGFSMKAHLKEHIRLHTGEKPLQCDICGRSFTHKCSLRYHILVHKGRRKLFRCDICQSGFSSKNNLINHIRIHTDEKPFQCKICRHSFTHKNDLISHSHMKHTGDKPYKCEICKRGFTTKGALTKHIRLHTGEQLYKCEICPHVTASNNQLKIHIKTHTGEKPYKCEICQRRFAKKLI